MNTYRFILQRGSAAGEGESIYFPLAPDQFNTSVGNKNKTIELVSIGEVNIVKEIGLRTFNFKLLLPKDPILLTDSYVIEGMLDAAQFHEPVWYLNRIREIKENKEIVFLIITRQYIDDIADDGTVKYKQLFGGNLKVTVEDYKVEENAGEEGDYWITLNLKEYRQVGIIKNSVPTGKIEGNKIQIKEERQREDNRQIPSTYAVKQGDSLWTIAKLYLGDGSKYKTLMELNGLNNTVIYPGQVLKLK